jgi:hypothetical protein
MMSEHHLRLVKLKNSDLCCVNYYEDLPLRERQQSRAGRRYNRIRRRLPQPIKTSRKWRIVSKRRYASRRW